MEPVPAESPTSPDHAAPSPFAVKILGPIEVVSDDGRMVDLGTRKQRALLTILTLASGRTISADRLVDELWGDEAPSRAMASLHPYVSNLRRLLEPGRPRRSAPTRLVTTAPGYALRLAADQVDAVSFERAARDVQSLVASGRYELALASGDSALSTWRGRALGEFAAEPFAVVEATRLEELRRSLTDDVIAARLALGDRQVAAEIERSIAEHPLRERSWELLMRALYAAGRQADALRAYQRIRLLLADELGIEPGVALRDLEAAILRQDPDLSTAGTAAVNLSTPMSTSAEISSRLDASEAENRHADPTPPDAQALVGRSAALGRALEALQDASGGRPRVLLITGEAGIGKTRLIEELVPSAEHAGFAVARGVCDDDGGQPFGPWEQVLRRIDGHGVELGPQVDAVFDAEARQQLVIDGIAARIRAAAAKRPLLIAIEDLHWADRSSLRCFEQLARRAMTEAVLIVGSCRDESTSELSQMLGGLSRTSGLVRVSLEGLESSEVLELARAQLGRPLDSAEQQVLLERTAGNPFFVIELSRWIDTHGVHRINSVPAGVADVVRRRVGRLPDAAADVVVVAAAIGLSFDLDLLESCCRLESDDLYDLVDVAVVNRIVEPVTDAPIGFRFVHAMVRDAILFDLPPLRRARLHAGVAEVLATRGPFSTELAAHRWEARTVAPDAARAACRDAARIAEAAFATSDAVRWWERAIALEPEGTRERAGLLSSLGRALGRTDRLEEGRDRLLEAIDLALASDDVTAAADAAAAIGGEWNAWIWSGFRTVPFEAVARLEAVLERLNEDPARRAAVLATLALGRYSDQEPAISDRLSEEALTLARSTGDAQLVASTLLSRCLALGRPDRIADHSVLLDELLGLDGVAAEHRTAALLLRGSGRLRAGDRVGAEADLVELRRIAHAGHLRSAEVQAQFFESVLAMVAGDTDRAEVLALDAAARTVPRVSGAAVHLGVVALMCLRRQQGRAAELLEPIEQVGSLLPISALDLLGPALVASGRLDTARELAADGEARREPPSDWLWLTEMMLRADVALALDDAELAQELYARLVPHRGEVGVAGSGFTVVGLVDATLGDLARLRGDSTTAAEHYRDAIATGLRVDARHWVAEAEHALANLG